jgi:hypothetical protein
MVDAFLIGFVEELVEPEQTKMVGGCDRCDRWRLENYR